MEFVKLGNSDVEVSRFGIGALDFGTKITEADARLIVDQAIDNGINLIDTADTYYMNGESETALGHILQGRRDRVVISTKFWNDEQHDAAYIRGALEASLRRLQTDYIDIYQPHHPSSKVPVGEVLETLDALVREGKIRGFGLSNHWAWQIARVHSVCERNGWHKPIAVECCYNLLNRSIENEIVPTVKWLNMGLLVYGALSRGLLTGKYLMPDYKKKRPDAWYYSTAKREAWKVLTPDNLETVRELGEIGSAHLPQCSAWTLAFRWLLNKPYVSSVIIGGSKPHHFMHVFEHILDFEISPDMLVLADYRTREFRYKPYENQFVTEML